MNLPVSSPLTHRGRQQGIALFIVIMFVMLSMLLALWASRSAWFNELVVSNDADYQRAFEAAQALLLDAELDIRGENADGSPCTPVAGQEKSCRGGSTTKIPLEASGEEGVSALLSSLEEESLRCKHALCVKRLGRQDFWNFLGGDDIDDLKSYEIPVDQLAATNIGARYGEYTGASPSSNPILADTSAWNRGGWYWIEVLNYDTSSEFSEVIVDPDAGAAQERKRLTLHLLPAVVYRITALAHGLKPGSLAVVQETYARTRLKD